MVANAVPAEQFGPYLVYERLGMGGMATVHRALERGIEGFERVVALKRLLPHLAEDASFIKSFVREAKLAALLNHVNIVQLFELGRVGTEYFISMEYIDGCDIRRILRHARRVTGPPPINVTVGLLLQLCDALDYAHGRADDKGQPLKLVHRDVSPSNLLVTKAGVLKVIDFGIAKAQSSHLHTHTGRVKGKLAYMAPEAVAGKDLDSRSDLFAAGVVAHELLTARPLFASKNEYQTLLKVQRGDIMPPSTFNHASPPELDALVLKALARDPNERFASAAELREALQALCRRHDLQTAQREIAQWVAWALSMEPPSGNFGANTLEQLDNEQARLAAAAAGAPDDAVELAWGGGDAPHEQGPVVLEDVPDVSDKHLAGSSADNLDLTELNPPDDLDDDLPPTVPSHGPAHLARRPRDARFGQDLSPALRNTMPGPEPRMPSARRPPQPDRAAGPNGGAAERELDEGAPPMRPPFARQVPPEALGTMRNVPPVSAATRVRADSVAPRDLPSLEPFIAPPAATRVGAGSGDDDDHDDDIDLLATARRRRPAQNISIGSSIIARRPRRSRWVILAGVVVAGGVAAATAGLALRGGEQAQGPAPAQPQPQAAPAAAAPQAAQAPARTTGTVKFVTVPEDSEIAVEGQPAHAGSPWSLELPAGVHQVAIQRSGYKTWLTSLELSPSEIQTLRVVLEPLGGAAVSTEATLIVSTTPPGLEVVLDGQILPQRTPIRMPIKPGRHAVAVRQDGVEVWRHALDARASVDYEFTPSMSEDKQRERAERAAGVPGAPAPDPGADERPTIVDVDRATSAPRAGKPGDAERATEHQIDSPSLPAIPPVAPAPAAPPSPAAAPVVIPPSAVTRTGGATPTISGAKLDGVPSTVAAKLCIDTAGRVSSVDVLTKLDPATAGELAGTLKSWTYAPYKQQGAPVPACFVVTFRAK
jgi:serine/threonine protein kinase